MIASDNSQPTPPPSPAALTAVTLVGALAFPAIVAFYGQWRSNNPLAYTLGSELLDPIWGLGGAAVLLVGSLLFAGAGFLGRRGRSSHAALFYSLVLVLAVDFLGIHAIQWSQLNREAGRQRALGQTLLLSQSQPTASVTAQPGAAAAAEPAAAAFKPGDADKGRSLFRGTCASCHGIGGLGLPGQGKDMVHSAFIAGLDDPGLVAFIAKGRMPNDPESTTGKLMPPRGGNTTLSDQDLADIVAYIRVIVKSGASAPSGGSSAASTATASSSAPQAAAAAPAALSEDEIDLARSVIPPAAVGPPGSAPFALSGGPAPRVVHPNTLALEVAQMPEQSMKSFVRSYLVVVGFQSLFVIAAALLAGVRIFRYLGSRGESLLASPLAEAFWHMTNVISLFVLPLWYFARWF
ncbi:c-type cytochrome [Candidatus Sumerlaeota bacterium]|nr:c-type cytochrome [Candidatus Sumerlaeota bacterium]